MKLEIGSDFWHYNLSNTKNNNHNNELSFMNNTIYLNSGRNAIRVCARQIKRRSLNILVPAYTCSTVIKPFIIEGFNVHYYDIDLKLNVNLDSLWDKTKKIKPDAVLFHAYFGFSTLKGLDRYITYAKNEGIKIIEDITQSIFSKYKRIDSDYIVSSMRKWFAIPDGGIVSSNQKIKIADNLYENTYIVELSIAAYNLKKLYMDKHCMKIKMEYMEMYKQAKQEIEDIKIYKMSNISKQIIANFDVNGMRQKRVMNFEFLSKELNKVNGIEVIFHKCKNGITPLFFPIYIKDRYKRLDFQKYLAKNNIYCPIIWPKPEEFCEASYSANYIYEHIICIPCDQRYNLDDMKRITEVIINFWVRQ